MKEFSGLALCEEETDEISISVQASLKNGVLCFSGNDAGRRVSELTGDGDYEYWYELDRDNTQKLLQIIHGEEDPEPALLREFSGADGCQRLRDLCEMNGIQYHFFCY